MKIFDCVLQVSKGNYLWEEGEFCLKKKYIYICRSAWNSWKLEHLSTLSRAINLYLKIYLVLYILIDFSLSKQKLIAKFLFHYYLYYCLLSGNATLTPGNLIFFFQEFYKKSIYTEVFTPIHLYKFIMCVLK